MSNLKQSTRETTKSVVIIGGGIGGLFCGWKLLQNGFKVTILERQKNLGGLSTSIPYNKYKMDIGPHFVTFPRESELTEEIKDLMNDNLISIPNIHQEYRVYFRNSVLKKYPTLYEIIFKKGFNSFLKSFFSFFSSRILQKDDFNFSAKEYLIYNYGKYLYQTWFKPYLDFSYGDSNIPVEMIRKKFPLLKFKDILKKTRKKNKIIKEKDNPSQVLHWYFKYGIGTLPTTLTEKIKELGGTIIVEAEVKNIEHEKFPKEILLMKNGSDNIITADIIVYTTPPNITKNWFNDFQNFDFRSSNTSHSIMVYLFINDPKIVNWWVLTNYDKNLPFFRITHQNFLSENVCPPGKSLLCIEIKCKENDDLWKLDESLLIKKISDSLQKMSIFDVKKIEDHKIFRFKNLYHGLEPNGKDISGSLSQKIDSIKNEFMIGVEIDAGALVTQRLEEEEKSEKPLVSYGGIYMTLEKSDLIVKKITSSGK